MSRDSILQSFVRVVEQAPLELEPFGHLRLWPVFPNELYPRLLENLPATDYYGELKNEDARLPSGRSARRKLELRPAQLRRLPEAQRTFWNAIASALLSAEVEAAYRSRFAMILQQRFGEGANKIRLRPAAMLLRDLGGYKISIHSDSLRKAITTQYYLPGNASQAHLGTAFHRKAADGSFIKATTLEFAPNSGYAFAVTASSWHGVEQMTDTDGERNSLMLIYYVDQGMAGETANWIKRSAQDLRARFAFPVRPASGRHQ